MAASQRNSVQVIYDLCHFGIPDGLDVFHPSFCEAFATFCYEAATRLRRGVDGPLFITPFNEPSYFAWAAGHAALFPPYETGRAMEMKVQIARAILTAIDAIWSVDARATIVNVDPICRAVAPRGQPDREAEAERFNAGAVMETWDMLSGRLFPDLGGSPRHLGVMGLNYYWTNQWELGSEHLPLAEDDDRRWPLSRLFASVSQRYGAPILLSETGHLGSLRASWVRTVTEQIRVAGVQGTQLLGVCFYPILGMPDWHEPERWLDMGLWDLSASGERMLHVEMHQALAELLEMQSVIGASEERLS